MKRQMTNQNAKSKEQDCGIPMVIGVASSIWIFDF